MLQFLTSAHHSAKLVTKMTIQLAHPVSLPLSTTYCLWVPVFSNAPLEPPKQQLLASSARIIVSFAQARIALAQFVDQITSF